MTHIYQPTQCHTCGEPLSEVWEALEPLSGLLVSELTCGSCGDGYIGTRVPPAGASAKGHEMNATETETRPTPAAAPHEERFAQVPLRSLSESPLNPRKHFDPTKLAELAASIGQHGIVEPLVVRELGDGYQIVAGARRFRAATAAGLESVPCVVRHYSDEDVMELTIVENCQRDDLSPLEQARGFRQLLTSNPDRFSVSAIAAKVGMSMAWVWDRIKLLDLIPEVQTLLERGRISVGHAVVIARQKPADQARIIGLGEEDGRGGLWLEERGLLDEVGEDGPVSYKPRSIREMEGWIADHIRFDVAHMAQAQPLDFEDVAASVEEAVRVAGPSAVVAITHDNWVDEDLTESGAIYTCDEWKLADGSPDAPACHDAVLGIVTVGARRGRSYDVCVASDKCTVHFAERIARQREAASPRAKGGASAPSATEEAWQREQQERRDRALRWEAAKPHVQAAAIEQVKTWRALTPAQVEHFEQDGQILIDIAQVKEVLGDAWHQYPVTAMLVSELVGYSPGADSYLAQAAALGLDEKRLRAVLDAHTPKPEPVKKAKKAKGRK